MRVAYADPPYPGNARRLYGPGAREVNFRLLVQHLVGDFDGWALSCGSKDLRQILPLFPKGIRVGAWVKGMLFYKPGVAPAYGWEPVIFNPARKNRTGRHFMTPVDWVKADATRLRGVPGAKPESFCFWIFRILGADPQDQFNDLFPGSGAVGRSWEKFSRQMSLLAGAQ